MGDKTAKSEGTISGCGVWPSHCIRGREQQLERNDGVVSCFTDRSVLGPV